MILDFDQGDLKKVELKDLIKWIKRAKKQGLEIKLRGFVRCEDCLNSVPLDMFVHNETQTEYNELPFPHDKDCSRIK